MIFSDLMVTAGVALGAGEHEAAYKTFLNALEAAQDDSELAQATRMAAVALRVGGNVGDAHQLFERALSLARTLNDHGAQVAHVKRDFGMNYLVQQNFEAAERLLTESRDEFARLGNTVETAVSEGFVGRYYLAKGDRTRALESLERADKQLRGDGGHPVYELNNLMVVIRAKPVAERGQYAERVTRLIDETRHMRRRQEYADLLAANA